MVYGNVSIRGICHREEQGGKLVALDFTASALFSGLLLFMRHFSCSLLFSHSLAQNMTRSQCDSVHILQS